MAYINKNDFSILDYIKDEDQENYFECDELIAPAISLLNKKGYETIFCCSGHPFGHVQTTTNGRLRLFGKFYVYFKDIYKFPELPYGAYFRYPKDKSGIIIGWKYNVKKIFNFELITKIFEINKEFYEWVEKLDSLN